MERYETIKKLAEGSDGAVYLCKDKQSIVDQKVAIKVFMQADKNPQILKSAIREATLLQHCKGHPHIVELHEAYRSDIGKVYLVMEYVPNVLSSIISDHTSTGAGLPPKLIWQYLKQLLLGVRHLHKNKIMHRDLKPANIMVTEGGTVKIIDLGLSRHCMPFKNVLTAYVQTRWYRAPELLVPGAPYSFEVDIWAVGCIAAEMITGKPLFPGRSHEDQLQVIMNCFGALPKRYMGDILGLETRDHKPVRPPKNGEATGLPGKLGPFIVQMDLLDFISACLTMDPLMRPSADHLLLHHMPDTKPARLQRAVQAGLGAGAISASSTPFANCAQHVQPTILGQSMVPIQVQHKQHGIHALSRLSHNESRFGSLAHDCMNPQPSPPASCFILSDNAVSCATEHEHYGPKRVSVKDSASLSKCLVTSHNRLQAVMHSDVSTEAVAVVDHQCQKEALMEGNIALGSKLPLISAAMPARQLVKKMGSSDDSSEEQSLPHLHGGSIPPLLPAGSVTSLLPQTSLPEHHKLVQHIIEHQQACLGHLSSLDLQHTLSAVLEGHSHRLDGGTSRRQTSIGTKMMEFHLNEVMEPTTCLRNAYSLTSPAHGPSLCKDASSGSSRLHDTSSSKPIMMGRMMRSSVAVSAEVLICSALPGMTTNLGAVTNDHVVVARKSGGQQQHVAGGCLEVPLPSLLLSDKQLKQFRQLECQPQGVADDSVHVPARSNGIGRGSAALLSLHSIINRRLITATRLALLPHDGPGSSSCEGNSTDEKNERDVCSEAFINNHGVLNKRALSITSMQPLTQQQYRVCREEWQHENVSSNQEKPSAIMPATNFSTRPCLNSMDIALPDHLLSCSTPTEEEH